MVGRCATSRDLKMDFPLLGRAEPYLDTHDEFRPQIHPGSCLQQTHTNTTSPLSPALEKQTLLGPTNLLESASRLFLSFVKNLKPRSLPRASYLTVVLS